MSQKRAVSKLSKDSSGNSLKFKLKNGLDVRLIPSTKSPVVSVQMWVKTGSADERRHEEGISHFIEHLLFKGTRKYNVGEIAKTVEASGGELNAWTSFDQTVFYVNISKEFTKTALDVVADMMGFPLFETKEIDSEREVVLEEIKRTNDNPGRKGSRLLFSSFYRKHPYRLPVIGRPEIIKSVTPRTLKKYFKERYSAKNMVLVVSGDFEPKQLRSDIAAKFSELPGGKVRLVRRRSEPTSGLKRRPPQRPMVFVEKSDVKSAQVFLAWPIPTARHKEIAALETLGSVFGGGASSRLVRTLRIDSDCVTSTGAGCFTAKDAGFFSVSAQLNPSRLTEAFAKIRTEIVGLLNQPIRDDEIHRAVVGIESGEIYGLETAEGLARKVGSLTTMLGDPSEFEKYLARVRMFDSETARKMSLKYLSPDSLRVICLLPESEDIAEVENLLAHFAMEIQEDWSRAKKEVLRRPLRPSSKSQARKPTIWKAKTDKNVFIERRTLRSGLKVIARIARSTPVVSAQLAFMGGGRLEPVHQAGLTELLSRTWTSGTKDLNEVELLNLVEAEAASLSAFGGRHTSGLSSHMLSRSQKVLQRLFVNSLLSPVFEETIITREKTMMLESLRMRADKPGTIAGRMFMETLFKNHPYAVDPLGSPESLAELTPEVVTAFHAKMICPADGVFLLTGDADLDSWCQILEKATNPFKSLRTGFSRQAFQWNSKHEIRRFHEIKKEQTTILIGWPGITLTSPQRFALQIAQAVLGGQGGRLFIELRDKNSLAYSVGPMSMEGVDAGYFGASIACSPEKGGRAIAMLKEEFTKLAETLLDQAEMDRAARYLIGSHDLGLQRVSSVGSAILFSEIYGIPAESVFDYAAQIRAVEAEDVRSLIADIIQAFPVITAVGPREPW
jgi:zinc protease